MQLCQENSVCEQVLILCWTKIAQLNSWPKRACQAGGLESLLLPFEGQASADCYDPDLRRAYAEDLCLGCRFVLTVLTQSLLAYEAGHIWNMCTLSASKFEPKLCKKQPVIFSLTCCYHPSQLGTSLLRQ
jgi:hypothetical protein